MISLTPDPVKTEITAADIHAFWTPPNQPAKLSHAKFLRHLAELALVECIPLFTRDIHATRTRGLIMDMAKYADRDQRKLKDFSEADKRNSACLIFDFIESSGWVGEKDTATILSFALQMIEESENKFNPKISEIIKELLLHFEDGKKLKPACLWAGSLAAEKWEKLFKEI